MPVVKDLIRVEKDGSISFGNYELPEKAKLSDFEYKGDLYKVKTYREITKLERNGMFVYESVPGTAVHNFTVSGSKITFDVEGSEDAQITIQMEEDREYEVFVNDISTGSERTNLSGKLVISVEMDREQPISIRIEERE